MKPIHVITLSVSCMAIGVLIALVVQSRLAAPRETADKATNRASARVLNPASFSEASRVIKPREAVEEVPDEPPVAAPAAPPGSGRRWTPLK